jgi:hypothetical protein
VKRGWFASKNVGLPKLRYSILAIDVISLGIDSISLLSGKK